MSVQPEQEPDDFEDRPPTGLETGEHIDEPGDET